MAKITFELDVDCPYCGSGEIIKAGKRNNYPRYQCKSCKKWFRNKVNIEQYTQGRKYGDDLVGATIDGYFQGLSIRGSARNIESRYGIPKPSSDTVFQWIKGYTEKATYALNDVKADTGSTWLADEMVVKADGRNLYLWNIMDKDTRFLLAAHLTESRSATEAIKVFQIAMDKAVHPPKYIITDKYSAYPVALRALLPDAKHIQSRGIRHWINNNMSERMQGTYRAREKTLRGLYSVESGQQLLDGITLMYNYFRDHMSLNKTPAEAAKIDVPFSKWSDVVRADIKVPESWVRQPQQRLPGQQEYLGHTQKGYRRRPRGAKKEKPYVVQTNFFSKRQPKPTGTPPVYSYKLKAPKPLLPESGSKPRPRNLKPPVLAEQEKVIPRRMRRIQPPKPVLQEMGVRTKPRSRAKPPMPVEQEKAIPRRMRPPRRP